MTPENLLRDIKALVDRKQMFASKGISIDTLIPALHITENQLMTLIEELQQRGLIAYHPAPSQRRGIGTILLAEQNV